VTAAAFLQLLNQLVYLVVTTAVLVEAIKRPRRTSIDTAFFSVALGLILEVTGLASELGLAIPSLVALLLVT